MRSVVRKTACLSDRSKPLKTKRTIDGQVRSRIQGLGRGAVFTPASFLRLGSRAAVDKALSRLAQTGTIRRLALGLYDYPKTDPQLGVLAPSSDAIAAALADSAKPKLQPSGAYAANLLGLSEQAPMKVIFLTMGTPRQVRIGSCEIILKRTRPRQMATAGRTRGLVIQALRHLRKTHVNAELLTRLRPRLTEEEKRQLLADVEHAPGWMAAHLRELAKG